MKLFSYPKRVKPIGRPNPKAPNMFGSRVPRYMADRDRDLTPNIVDCSPNNPRRQGRVGDWLAKKGEQYKEWKEKAPERRTQRHEERMEKLKYRREESEEKLAIQKARAETASSRTNIGMQRVKLMKARQQAMPKMEGIDGFGSSVFSKQTGSSPSIFTPMPSSVPKTKKKKKKVRYIKIAV